MTFIYIKCLFNIAFKKKQMTKHLICGWISKNTCVELKPADLMVRVPSVGLELMSGHTPDEYSPPSQSALRRLQ